jgi:hypothetical protein
MLGVAMILFLQNAMGFSNRPIGNPGYRVMARHAAPRRSGAQEHMSAGRHWTTFAQILGDCLSDIVRQRQRALLTSFAAHINAAVMGELHEGA